MKYLIILFPCLLSFMAGYYYYSASHPVEEPESKAEIPQDFLDKLQSLKDLELEAYAKLEDADAKLKKSEEILGKIFLIFLADLGLKTNGVEKDFIQKLATPQENIPSLEVSTAVSPTEPIVEAEQETSPAPQEILPKPEVGQSALDSNNRDFSKDETHIEYVENEEAINRRLKNVELKDLYSAMKNQIDLKPRDLEKVLGKFTGSTKWKNKKTHPWDVTIEISGKMEKGKFNGNTLIQILKEGNKHSTTSGTGDLKGVTKLSNNSRAILIEASQGDVIFQVYYLKNFEALAGNIYVKQKNNDYRIEGTVYLKK